MSYTLAGMSGRDGRCLYCAPLVGWMDNRFLCRGGAATSDLCNVLDDVRCRLNYLSVSSRHVLFCSMGSLLLRPWPWPICTSSRYEIQGN